MRAKSLLVVALVASASLSPPSAAHGETAEAPTWITGRRAVEAVSRADPSGASASCRTRSRPVLPHSAVTEHFRIWYATEGEDMIYGWPDTTYLHECKVAAERCWRGQVDTLGFRAPPPDGGDPDGGGGDNLYDIYIENLFPGVLGYCQPGYLVPGTYRDDCTSFLHVENDYEGWSFPDRVEPLKMAVAHEFNRACQFSHNYSAAGWFQNATTVWVAERMYDEFNWYIMEIGAALTRPYETPECDGILLPNCGWALWEIYLSTAYGHGVILEMWQALEDTPSVTVVIESVLAEHGTTFDDTIENFWVWNWFTGARHDGGHYEESWMWPTAMAQKTFSSYPVIDGAPPTAFRPDRFACNYIRFVRGACTSQVLLLSYDGPSTSSVPNAAHVAYLDNDGASHYYGEIPLNPWGNGSLCVEDFSEMSEVGLIVVNKSVDTASMDYLVNAEVIPGSVAGGSTSGILSLAPNPFRSTAEITLAIPAAAGPIELSVYDLRGRRVITLVEGEQPPGIHTVVWEGTDECGERVSSGVYFVRVAAPGFGGSRKMILLK